MPTDPIVVVGGGLAAARAVEALRGEGYDGDVVLLTSEPHRPYERPPLSKGYLRGQEHREDIFVLGENWYGEHGVELRTSTTVAAVDPASHRITLVDGATLPFSTALLATGSTPRSLGVPGSDFGNVHYLRTVDDADRLAGTLLPASLEGTGEVVVIGDGWIGMEVAASARELGLDVTVLGRGAHPLAVLGPELGELYGTLHQERGVRLHRQAEVVRLTGVDGQVTGVDLADGTHVAASVVVVGVGVTPNVGLACAAGLELRSDDLGGGVAVDGYLRTSHPDVFAAGDIASVPAPRYGRPLRVEHWAAALEQGKHAGRAMLGLADPYDLLPYFFSDQFDVGMEYKGYVDVRNPGYEVVVSGSTADRELVAFYVRDGRVEAGMAVNVWDRMDDVERLIRSTEPVAREELEGFVAA
ncbi:NAD(P)/FAD-dependent oxidoreductase [Isoptericola variabilis]|uniref:Ferredoxin--NAD(+) reductase n=1 Tax=Isoptericola variabilis (strain 225) TaxID=743718 RepID=F6FUI0_ISOV2|nr:FAD/NAD(P)-binding oxidoreductase [Isoptericola variabilis]AEG45407.1 Ferredoxin--NAD(+) reductase [Isoptericola variabilis 225]TWH28135.1 3-phenylpropionate/trans-cinnamate dioxygenase ferredoxin reductase subunit [Isoptericola variabilis J7]